MKGVAVAVAGMTPCSRNRIVFNLYSRLGVSGVE